MKIYIARWKFLLKMRMIIKDEQSLKNVSKRKKEKKDAIAMEAEAQEIIGKIVSLLAGQPITNDTVWNLGEEGGYTSQNVKPSMKDSQNNFL